MAYTSGYTGDATSGIGQGLAFVLPEGKSQQYAMQLAQTHSAQLQDIARQKQIQALKLQQQYEQDFKDQKLPQAFAPYDDLINKRFNDALKEGASRYATTGKNPYNDPAFKSKFDDLNTMARKSKELGDNYTKLAALAGTDPNNKYTKESKQKVLDYLDEIKKNPEGVLDKPLPQLVETPASADDFVKEIRPLGGGDLDINKSKVFVALHNNPEKWGKLASQYGVDLGKLDFGIYADPQHSTGKRTFHTDDAFADWQAKDILAHPNDPNNAQHIKDFGWDISKDPNGEYNDHKVEERIKHAIIDQNAGWNKMIGELGSQITDPEKTQQLKDQRQSQQVQLHNMRNADKRLAIEEERLKMAKDKEHADNIVNNLFENTDPTKSLERFSAISKLYESNGYYGKKLDIKDDGTNVTITVPARKKINPQFNPILGESKINPKFIETVPAHTVHLDRNNPYEFKAGIYQLLKNTGSPAAISKFVESKGTGNDKQHSEPKAQPGKKSVISNKSSWMN